MNVSGKIALNCNLGPSTDRVIQSESECTFKLLPAGYHTVFLFPGAEGEVT